MKGKIDCKNIYVLCDECEFFDYPDNESNAKICNASFDQDDFDRFISHTAVSGCPFFKFHNEYSTVKRQI